MPMAFARQTPGQDGAGEIDAVGEGVNPARIGERVWIYHAALSRPTGTAAQYTVLPAGQAVPLAPAAGFDQGAGLGIPFMIAHYCLLADGQDILIAGGGGAVGNAAIQLAKRAEARVITTVSSPAKAQLARRAGADTVITGYRRPEAAQEILAAAPHGVHRIIELALSANLPLDLTALRPGGTIITYAFEDAAPPIPVRAMMLANVRLTFMLVYTIPAAAHAQAVDAITAALADSDLRPLPIIRFPLEEIAAAHEAVEKHATGKVIIDLPYESLRPLARQATRVARRASRPLFKITDTAPATAAAGTGTRL